MDKQFRDRLKTLGIVAVVLLLCVVLKIPCFMRSVTGIPCPSCGMTRAWLAALQLDFSAAFSYHPMFWTVPVFGAMFLFVKKKVPVWLWILLGLICMGYVVSYVFCLVGYFTGTGIV